MFGLRLTLSLTVLLLAACCSQSALPDVAPPEGRHQQRSRVFSGLRQLRIVNNGPEAVQDLVVISPFDEVAFGDIAVGATTTYREQPGGVYQSLAFSYRKGTRRFTQPIVDWDGGPLRGDAYTFTLTVSRSAGAASIIQIVKISQDR